MDIHISHMVWSFRSILEQLSHIPMDRILLYAMTHNARYGIALQEFVETPTS